VYVHCLPSFSLDADVDHLTPRLMILNIVGGMFEKGHVLERNRDIHALFSGRSAQG
jgi:hypothetical protein